MPHSNVLIYAQIIKENYAEMVEDVENNREPKEDGNGYILRYDPTRSSFKKSMIVIAFTGMWLEAMFHLFMVEKHSKNQFHKHEKKSYREKLELIGVSDAEILAAAENFQNARNELIHEKAYMDKGEIKLAQAEAVIAYNIVEHVSKHVII